MPDSLANSTLAPLAGKLTATKAADVPLNKIKLPPGFKVEVWADSVPGSRAIAQGDNGKYYVGSRPLGRVYEITDNGTTRTSRVVIDKLDQPTVAFRDGSLYVMAVDKVLRFDNIDKNPTVAPIDLVAALRETTILYDALIGAVAFGEKMNLQKGIAAALIVAGVIVTRF